MVKQFIKLKDEKSGELVAVIILWNHFNLINNCIAMMGISKYLKFLHTCNGLNETSRVLLSWDAIYKIVRIFYYTGIDFCVYYLHNRYTYLYTLYQSLNGENGLKSITERLDQNHPLLFPIIRDGAGRELFLKFLFLNKLLQSPLTNDACTRLITKVLLGFFRRGFGDFGWIMEIYIFSRFSRARQFVTSASFFNFCGYKLLFYRWQWWNRWFFFCF